MLALFTCNSVIQNVKKAVLFLDLFTSLWNAYQHFTEEMSYYEDKTCYVCYFDVKHLYLQLNLKDVFIHLVFIVTLALLVLCPPGKWGSSDAISYNQCSLSVRQLKKLYHLKFLPSYFSGYSYWAVGWMIRVWMLEGVASISSHCFSLIVSEACLA